MKLSIGDTVSIIAPAAQSSGDNKHFVAAGQALLEKWGLTVNVRVDAGNHFYLAGSDAVRLRHLHDALADPKVKAIFCTRGGYGSPRLLAGLDPSLKVGKKFLVGFSDITSLHLAAQRIWPNVECVHGPNVATNQLLGTHAAAASNRQSLHMALFEHRRLCEQVEFLIPGQAQGPLVGGCLSLVASNVGTAYSAHTDGAILFLEDTGEPPYRIDRMLCQLRNAGVFDGVNGIVFGEMERCADPYNDLREVIVDLLSTVDVPIAFGLRRGHGETNLSVRLGGTVKLDCRSEGHSRGHSRSNSGQFVVDGP